MKHFSFFIISIFILILCTSSAKYEEITDPMFRALPKNTIKPDLCLVGDSRVYLWPKGFLEKKYDVFNYGVAGTRAEYSAFILGKLFNEGKNFKIIIISTGINDPLFNEMPETTVENLKKSIENAKKLSDKIFITTIPGCTKGSMLNQEQIEKLNKGSAFLNEQIKKLAEQTNIGLIPMAELLKDENSKTNSLNSAYNDGSGLHYNDSAYKKIFELYKAYGI